MGTIWRLQENFEKKTEKLRFFNSITVPKNVKGGKMQNIETNEGGTLWCNTEVFKKVS